MGEKLFMTSGSVARGWCGTMPVHRRLLDTDVRYGASRTEIETFTFHECRP
jgi:hypothetical protein